MTHFHDKKDKFIASEEDAMIEELHRTPKRDHRPQSDYDRYEQHLKKGKNR